MKKKFSLYVVAWAVLVAVFNVIAFVVPSFPSQEKFTTAFWIGYSFITAMFVAQLICAYVAFKADSLRKMFYNIPIIRTSYIGLALSFIAGGVCMIVSVIPYWVAILVCVIILAFNIFAVIKASAVANIVEKVDEKIKVQTFFVKSLTVDADTLMAQAKSEAVKAECRKVYEAIRYSDPMSNDALASVEGQITVKFAELSEAVKMDDANKVTEIANEIIILIGDRNKKCKLLK